MPTKHPDTLVEVGNSLSIASTSGQRQQFVQACNRQQLVQRRDGVEWQQFAISSGGQMPMSESSCISTSSRQDDAFEVSFSDHGLLNHGSSVPFDYQNLVGHQIASNYRNVVQPRRSRRSNRQKRNSEYYYLSRTRDVVKNTTLPKNFARRIQRERSAGSVV